jgi:glyoxylase-like metal-dependent hydrolase (beta-lactamase superfamily II)
VLFDLGTRPDWRNYAPKTVALISATTIVTPGTDVATMLDEADIRRSDIAAIIWSHNHFDHIGDVTRFPKTTALVIGPNVRAATWPGWPTRADAIVLDADIEGREVLEIAFDTGLKVGRFDAFDYFGDGSFYLLDGPGHAVGHLCALARTTAAHEDGGSSFVFMGADACHHVGVLRPSAYHALPSSVKLQQFLGEDSALCPGLLLDSCLSSKSDPFLTVAAPSLIFPDKDASFNTVSKIQELDGLESVFVVMAHDQSIRDTIPLFPKKINGWKTSGIKGQSRWAFCRDLCNLQK